MHFSAEGKVEFKALLFISKLSSAQVFKQYLGKQTSTGLCVQRVLVADMLDVVLPRHLHLFAVPLTVMTCR